MCTMNCIYLVVFILCINISIVWVCATVAEMLLSCILAMVVIVSLLLIMNRET